MPEKLPEGWKRVALGDIGRFNTSSVDKLVLPNETAVSLVNYMDVYRNQHIDGSLDFMQVTATAAECIRYQLQVGDLLFTPSSETPDDIGHSAAIIGVLPHTLHSYHTVRFRPVGKVQLDVGFSGYMANGSGVQSYFARKAAGSTRFTLGLSSFAEVFINLPPLPEQKRIAEILSTVDEAIEQTEALIAKTQQIKAGLMHELFTRGVTPNGQLRSSREEAPQLYKESPLGWIPKEWDPKTAAACAADSPGSTTIGPFGSNLVTADYRSEGVPVVFVRDIKEEGFRWISGVYVTSEKAYELSSHSIRSGDIVATKMGFPPCIACSYPDWMPPGVITADIIRLRPNTTAIDVRWLSAALNCDAVKRQVQAITAGVTRPKITLADFRTLVVACPGYDEQVMIGDRLDAINVVLAEESSRANKLAKQKCGLMHDLLSGTVEVSA